MLPASLVLGIGGGYLALLFVIAFIVDRRSRQGPMRWMHSPVIYTLSISVYCTSWTFYGAVGSAARNGLGCAGSRVVLELDRGLDVGVQAARDGAASRDSFHRAALGVGQGRGKPDAHR